MRFASLVFLLQVAAGVGLLLVTRTVVHRQIEQAESARADVLRDDLLFTYARGGVPALRDAVQMRGRRMIPTDAVLLLAGLVGIIVWFPAHPFAAIGIPFVWLLGVIEYVNYFVVRLAYPPSVWFKRIGEWRTPRLLQDVRAAQRS